MPAGIETQRFERLAHALDARHSSSGTCRAWMDNTEIEELFTPLGPVTIRRMFGGKGIYHQGRIIAIELRDELMLKGDAVTAAALEAAGARRWTYEGRRAGKTVAMPYWSVPDAAFDDPDEMRRWLRLADEAAIRAGKG